MQTTNTSYLYPVEVISKENLERETLLVNAIVDFLSSKTKDERILEEALIEHAEMIEDI